MHRSGVWRAAAAAAIVVIAVLASGSGPGAHAENVGTVVVTAQARPRLECTRLGSREVLVRSNVRWMLESHAALGPRTEVRGGKTSGQVVRLPENASFSLMPDR